MSYGKRPTGESRDPLSRGAELLRTAGSRLRDHLETWPRRYVKMRVEARED